MKNLKKAALLAVIAAPAPSVVFNTSFGSDVNNEYAGEVVQTADGGYITVGGYSTVTNENFNSDFLVVKADANGNPVWTKTFGDMYDDYANGVVQTADGGYVAVGYTSSDVDSQVFVIKLDANGNTVWSKTHGDVTSPDTGSAIKKTADGGFIVGGSLTTANGDLNQALWKLDANGNLSWTNNYGTSSTDAVEDVIVTSDGGYLLAGHTMSNIGNRGDLYLTKTTSTGAKSWSKYYGSTNDDRAYEVLEDNGSFVVTGYSGTPSGYTSIRDVLLFKTDLSGNQTLWKTYGTATGDEWGMGIVQKAGGGYVIGGSAPAASGSSDLYALGVDAAGTQQWSRLAGGMNNDFGGDITATADGGYTLFGHTTDDNYDTNLNLIKIK